MKILFEGYLAEMYPQGIEVAADTAHEAVQALAAFPGFEPESGVRHTVIIRDFDSFELLHAITKVPAITLVPVLLAAGGGGSPFKQVLIGAVLVGLSFWNPVAGTKFAAFLLNAGAGLVIGGLIQLISPAPRPEDSGSDKRSRMLGADGNTTRIGTPIPLLFGRSKVNGHYLSFDVDAKDFNPE